MSDSEDGQLRNEDDELMSIGMDDIDYDNEDDDEEERDADLLNIKPPQAIVTRSRERDSHGFSGRRGKEKLSVKDKKHSKERRHKERSSLKERDLREERERRDHTNTNSGGGGGGSSGERRRGEEMERYVARGNYDDSHVDTRRIYGRHFDSGRGNHYHHQHYHQQYHHIQHMQQRPQQHHHQDYYERTSTYHHHSSGGGSGMDYHGSRQYTKHSGSSGGSYGGNHHDDNLTAGSGERERDRDRDRDRERDRDRDRERRKYASSYDQPPKDAESLEQDLRSRLLSKRHNYVRSRGRSEELDELIDRVVEYQDSHEEQRMHSRHEKKRDMGSGFNNSVIEVLDSPEAKTDNHCKPRRRHRNRHADISPGSVTAATVDKRKTPDDPELLARRARFLAAEREKVLRKEIAREELQARRELLRERERNDNANVNASGTLSPSAVAASVTAGLNVIKRKVDEDTGDQQNKRKRAMDKARNSMNDDEVEQVDSDVAESVDADDDSVSLSASENDSGSHTDSCEAMSASPPAKARRKHAKKHRLDSERESSRSKGDDNDSDNYESDRSLYEKTKSKRKLSKRSKGAEAVLDTNEVGGAHSDIESHSASASPVESEDSFYANRKREKRGRNDDESSTERKDKDVLRSSKTLKASHKSKKHAKAKHKLDEDEEVSESPISEGSIKAHRARKHRKKKLPDDEDSGSSRSVVSELDSDDSYYEKKKHRRRHHHKVQKESRRKSKHKSGNDGSELSASSMSEDTREDEEEFENGVHGNSDSNDEHERKPRRRKYSHEANKFLADINEVDMKDLSKDETKKDRRGNGAESGVDSVTLDEDEVETIYDDKGMPLPNYYPGIQGCRTVEEFQCLNRIEEGTYGVVYRARDQRTNEIVALKRLKMEKEREGFPITSLREINTLLKGQHPNIVTVREIVVGSNMDKIFIVMDYVEHDLKSLMETMKTRKQIFFPGEVKCLTQQLLRAVSHLHDNWILHRDLKTSNLLLSHKGILKVGDFGLAREYGSPLRKYTSLVVTRWYRAPELLLCSPMYSTPIDIWSVGCIFAEFLLMTPYLPGKSDIDQLNRIFRELGTPNEKIWPGYNELPAVKNVLSQNTQFADYPMSNLRKRFNDKVSEAGISLLQGLLTYDPKQRLTAEAALEHSYFKELPLPIDPAMFPTWPAKSEMGSTRKSAHSPKPPSGGAQFKQLGQDDIAITVGKTSGINTGNASQSASGKVVSGIITGNKKTAANTGFVLNAGIDQRQLAMGPGFNLKF